MVNDNERSLSKRSLSIEVMPIQYLNNNLLAIDSRFARLMSDTFDIRGGEFVYKKSYEKKELRGVFLYQNSAIWCIGEPCYFNKNDQFFSWGNRSKDIFFLHSYNDEKMFDYILYLKNPQQMQVFSVETKNLYRQITTQHSIKIHDSYIGLEENLAKNASSDTYRWRESFVFTINFLNRAYHFRYRVKDGTIILFHDGTKKLDLQDSKYFSGIKDKFFYFGSKDYVVDTSNDRVFYLIKHKDKEVIGTVFMGFLSQDFKAMLDRINASSDNDKKVDSLIELFEGYSTWIRLKIICMTYFFKIKYRFNLLFRNFF